MTDNESVVNEVASYVTAMFRNYLPQNPQLVYHNLQHTQTVVARSSEIASFYLLDESEICILLSAAWFHDCGHLFGAALDHEFRSVLRMKEYMETIHLDNQAVKSIESCILATRLPSKPKNLLEEILCDADLYHLGTNEFFAIDSLVKKEYELRNNFVAKNWYENSLRLLLTHRFYTGYCRHLLNKGKLENMRLLAEKMD